MPHNVPDCDLIRRLVQFGALPSKCIARLGDPAVGLEIALLAHRDEQTSNRNEWRRRFGRRVGREADT